MSEPMFNASGDLCLSFFKDAYECGMFAFPHGARVLEVGCAEADWLTPMKAARPDLHLTGIDVRECRRPGADELIVGDILTHPFPPASFDCIVAVSAMEHVGLGYYGDPIDDEGDTKAMARLRGLLRPGGWIYLDVPYRPDGPHAVNRNYRAYSPDSLVERLLPGWERLSERTFSARHPDAPFIALTLTPA